MIRKFKFFEGIIENVYTFPEIDPMRIRRIGTQWTHQDTEELNTLHGINAEAELTRLMTEQISRAIDENIINELTRTINGGYRA
jgi:hypothetical protein